MLLGQGQGACFDDLVESAGMHGRLTVDMGRQDLLTGRLKTSQKIIFAYLDMNIHHALADRAVDNQLQSQSWTKIAPGSTCRPEAAP